LAYLRLLGLPLIEGWFFIDKIGRFVTKIPAKKCYLFFLDLVLSIKTVAKIKEPPINVFRFGFSPKKIMAKTIPKMGCRLVIILAVLTVKCLKLLTSMVWPMAVVKTASIIM